MCNDGIIKERITITILIKINILTYLFWHIFYNDSLNTNPYVLISECENNLHVYVENNDIDIHVRRNKLEGKKKKKITY